MSSNTHAHTCTCINPRISLTVHRAPLWLCGGRCGAAAGHTEVGGECVRHTQGRTPHVFGPELLPPRWSSTEVLIIILDRRQRKRKEERCEFFTHCICVASVLLMCLFPHLFNSPLSSNGHQTVKFALQSSSSLQKRGFHI